jgi:hypothetical protein
MTTTSVAAAAEAVTPTQRQEAPEGAVASLVCGIIGLLIPFVGFVLGIIAMVLGNKARKQPNGGMGMAGFVLGIITTVSYGLLFTYLIGVAIFVATST